MNSNQQTSQQAAQGQLVEIITPGSIVDVAMSSGFYARLQHLTYALVEPNVAHLTAAHEKIQQNKVTVADGWIYNYETMLILNKEIEKVFREKGHTEMRDPATLSL
jgi:hypothetical protein